MIGAFIAGTVFLVCLATLFSGRRALSLAVGIGGGRATTADRYHGIA
jgi:hypothetical protein